MPYYAASASAAVRSPATSSSRASAAFAASTSSAQESEMANLPEIFRDVPRDEVKRMLHTNCKELYRLDAVPDRLPTR